MDLDLGKAFHPNSEFFLKSYKRFVILSPELIILRNNIISYLQPAVEADKKYLKYYFTFLFSKSFFSLINILG